MRKKLISIALFLAALFFVQAQEPVKVRLGFNPTQNSDELSVAAQSIADYLEEQFAGAIEVEVFLPTEYRGLI
jgi:phosphonate transport system substrate-binding protein